MGEPKDLDNDSSSNNSNIKGRTRPMDTTRLSKAIEKARETLDPSVLAKKQINVLDRSLKARIKEYVLAPNEEILFMIRQSRLHDPIPELIIFTNEKIVVAQPSVMHLFGITSLAFKTANFIQYTRITDLTVKRGLYLRSIFIKIIGSDVTEIEGLKKADADLAIRFILDIVECLEG
jgi:hypothetical protein